MEIEEVAAQHPREDPARWRSTRSPASSSSTAAQLAFGLGLEGKQVGAAVKFMAAMYRAFVELDCSIVEINPLVVTGDGRGGRARRQGQLRRQRAVPPPDIEELRDESEEDPAELEAARTRSTTSSSTATSAAWSTAPAWPWRPWTSSSCTAARRPTSSTSAAAPPRSG